MNTTKFVFAFGAGVALLGAAGCSSTRGGGGDGSSSDEQGVVDGDDLDDLGTVRQGYGSTGGGPDPCLGQVVKQCTVTCALEGTTHVNGIGKETINEYDPETGYDASVLGCAGGGHANGNQNASMSACTYTDANGASHGARYGSWGTCSKSAEVFANCKFSAGCTGVSILVGGIDRVDIGGQTEANASDSDASGYASVKTSGTLSVWGMNPQPVSANSDAQTTAGGCEINPPNLTCSVELRAMLPPQISGGVKCSVDVVTCHAADNHADSSSFLTALSQLRYVSVASPPGGGDTTVQLSNIAVQVEHSTSASASHGMFGGDGAHADAKASNLRGAAYSMMRGLKIGSAPLCTNIKYSAGGKRDVTIKCVE